MPMPVDARHALLARLIDHAPLFPPAELPLEEALEEDARAAENERSWMLGRFVCPASRLAELPGHERGLSAVLDVPLPSGARVEAVEARYRDALDELVGIAPEVYVEVRLDGALEARLDALAECGLRAKVRCGGETPPSVGALARFVSCCRDRELVFKATAGLHHAVRSGSEHGFLNLLAAVVFGDEERALVEEDADVFGLDADAFTWQALAADAPQLVAARRDRLHSIGSCSFFEPVEELEALGLLP